MTSRSSLIAVVGLAMLLPCCQASASFIIDDFGADLSIADGAGHLINNYFGGAGSTDRTIETNLNAEVISSGGKISLGLGSGAIITFKYHFDAGSGIDLHSDGLSRFLQVPFNKSNSSSTGIVKLTVNYKSTITGGDLSFDTRDLTAANDAIQVFDGHELGDGALASAVTDLWITFTRFSGINSMDNDFADLQAVPEPTTMALLGISSFGAFGLAFLRRRKAGQKVA